MLRKMDAAERQAEHQGKENEARFKANELARERMISDFTQKAAEAYGKILTRYPAMNRYDDAKARLVALHQPVPRPTKTALAQSKAEEASRGEQTMLARTMGLVNRHPDMTPAAKVGDPSLQDKAPMSATGIVQRATRVAMGNQSDSKSVTVETTGTDAPPENQPAPRSDAPVAENIPGVTDPAQPAQPDPNELKPTEANQAADAKPAEPDPNELKPNVDPQPAPAPAQVNEIQPGAAQAAQPAAASASSSDQDLADDNAIASSKHKKKKGLRKVIPFQ
jgi:outer membrane protein assembly factor BamD